MPRQGATITVENYVYVCLGMNKHEVAEFLGVSAKTVERYARAGKLKTVYVQGKAMFDNQEVEALKTELETPVHRAIPVPTDSDSSGLSLSVAPETSAMLMPVLQTMVQQFVISESNKHLYQKLTLSLNEAVSMSGFSKKGILEAAKQGYLVGVKQGGSWRFRPGDIIRFVDSYFDGNFENKNGRKLLPDWMPEQTAQRH